MKEHDSGIRIYLVVWGALVVLTAVTVAVSYVHLGLMNVVVALLVASVKASLVALFFMHLRYESKLVWGFALTPVFFLVLIIAGTLLDTSFR
ncbi:MAG TPA: cytochrome C oxidase subunit IV family protein [Candidatus Limnocylindria bacterium]|nr:cytochrome C oxidase subunit IV family protein [Candidatus Limnocylindria bacterium]